MADDDSDLDADFELFERQLQAAVAKVPKSAVPPLVHPPKPAPPSAPACRPQPPKALPTGRWKWDGTAWRWRTDLAAPTVQTHTQPSSPLPPANATVSAPHTAAQPPSTHAVAQASNPAHHDPAIVKRTAAGKVWHDTSLLQFPPNDHRLFVGDLAPDASEQHLDAAFSDYPSYNMSRVIRDKHSGACKGYGFLSFADGRDMLRAMSEMNGKYVAGRPLKLKRGKWEKRALKGKWNQVKALRTISKR